MTELYKTLEEVINVSNRQHLINHITLVNVLLDHGLVTEEDVNATRQFAIHAVDQAWTEKFDKLKKDNQG